MQNLEGNFWQDKISYWQQNGLKPKKYKSSVQNEDKLSDCIWNHGEKSKKQMKYQIWQKYWQI